MSEQLLKARNMRCERGGRVLFENLEFSVAAGEVVQLCGPNGSGKTTLLRSLSGLSSCFSGDLLWRDEPIRDARFDYLSDLLYIGHSAGIKAALSPLENLHWSVSSRQMKANSSYEQALDRVGLYGYEDTPCFMLSAGQQRRVNLARLFLLQVSLWILDEPFTAIDTGGVAELEGWLGEHVSGGGAVLLTTHHELNLDVPVKRVELVEPC